MTGEEKTQMHRVLSGLYSSTELARISSVKKMKRYSKSGRFKSAAKYWEGFAHANILQLSFISRFMRSQKCWPPLEHKTAAEILKEMIRDPAYERVSFFDLAVVPNE